MQPIREHALVRRLTTCVDSFMFWLLEVWYNISIAVTLYYVLILQLLAVHEISGDSLHHVSSSDFGEAAAEISTCKNLVNLTVAPTRIHITQDDPWVRGYKI